VNLSIVDPSSRSKAAADAQFTCGPVKLTFAHRRIIDVRSKHAVNLVGTPPVCSGSLSLHSLSSSKYQASASALRVGLRRHQAPRIGQHIIMGGAESPHRGHRALSAGAALITSTRCARSRSRPAASRPAGIPCRPSSADSARAQSQLRRKPARANSDCQSQATNK
jgi:hypothetical protein